MKNWVIGNWKMNLTLTQVRDFCRALPSQGFSAHTAIAPQSIHLQELLNQAPNYLQIGAQNCSAFAQGAYTGEISPVSLKDLGAKFCLVGHSERRQYQKEDHTLLNQKMQAVLKAGLTAVLCVGETLQERENQQTFAVVKNQLNLALRDIEDFSRVLIAYEPVWAIGTGKVASEAQAEEVHEHIAHHLSQMNKKNSSSIPLLYGGSVTPENFKGLIAQPHIHGALVGGASLRAASFTKLCEIASY